MLSGGLIKERGDFVAFFLEQILHGEFSGVVGSSDGEEVGFVRVCLHELVGFVGHADVSIIEQGFHQTFGEFWVGVHLAHFCSHALGYLGSGSSEVDVEQTLEGFDFDFLLGDHHVECFGEHDLLFLLGELVEQVDLSIGTLECADCLFVFLGALIEDAVERLFASELPFKHRERGGDSPGFEMLEYCGAECRVDSFENLAELGAEFGADGFAELFAVLTHDEWGDLKLRARVKVDLGVEGIGAFEGSLGVRVEIEHARVCKMDGAEEIRGFFQPITFHFKEACFDRVLESGDVDVLFCSGEEGGE